MKRKPSLPSDAAELRKRAEVQLHEQGSGMDPARTAADNERLIHELQVHQIELEMQQAELLGVRGRLECELEKYSDLYDFAPISYLTLDREGVVREANLGTTRLLGMDRCALITRRFALCVLNEDRRAFADFLTRVFEGKAKESCEISLVRTDGSSVSVRVEATLVASARECRTVITDLTERNLAEQDRLILGKLESTGILAGGIAYFSTKQRGTDKGMGLGLTICRSVIQKHAGTMTVSSEPGTGTTFDIYLPAFHGALSEVAAPTLRPTKAHGRILVMDDEEPLRSVLGKLCQRLGHEVEVVPDGKQAVAAYVESREQGHPFDLVLLDLTVRAGAGGLESIKKLFAIDPSVKALAMSGNADDPVMLHPQTYGFHGVLYKPFDVEKLQEAILETIGP